MMVTFWALKFFEDGPANVFQYQSFELIMSGIYFVVTGSFYFFWLRSRLKRSVQVFEDHILVHNGKLKEPLYYAEIQSVNLVCWSIFYVKMNNGFKYYFNSSLERVDYIWEGIHAARPELVSQEEFEAQRIKLVQYDHHQKRKEWFFKHKLVDVFNWAVLPVVFLVCAYFVQSRNIYINQQGLYFFRLFMYALLVLLSTTFFYSLVLKKFVFDKKVEEQMSSSEDKMRDLEFEGVVLQRSKIFQFVTACFLLAMVIRMDVNLYSVSKVKEDLASFNLKRGSTILVDNRFNCIACRYELKDGDLVLFGRGTIGQVLAREGDMVGQIGQDPNGRTIASENVQEVPRGHLAVKSSNGKDIVFIKIEDLIGKIQK
ncbi:hypothetical protein ACJVC5_04925 [Peredibacter sp. HCB2-198]|uniref:hypothetical protein n=1 Tax=Peredibacter sp. HCB2-198 TaxID=3383025 RepID=UPI0038B53AA9